MATPQRKRKGDKVTGTSAKPASRQGKRAVNVWLPESLVEAMHAYLESFPLEPSATSLVKASVEAYLADKGHWPPKDA